MEPKLILVPLFAQVLLTFLVWLLLVYSRVTTILRQRINPQVLANEARSNEIYKDITNLSDNFENLFEVPVLFYAAALLIFQTGKSDAIFVGLAWVFVAIRALHSLIHCTSNIILYRFYAYLSSTAVLLVIWIKLGLSVL